MRSRTFQLIACVDIDINYDGILNNPATFEGLPAPRSMYSFFSDTELLSLTMTSNLGGGVFEYINIFIDNVFYQKIDYISDINIHQVALSAGNKRIDIVNAYASFPKGLDYKTCYLTSLAGDGSYQKINESNLSEKLVFLGDSITCGAFASNVALDAWNAKFMIVENKNINILGGGGSRLRDYASTSEKITDIVVKFRDCFNNTTGVKKIIIALGTNDYGISPMATDVEIETWSTNLVNALIADNATYNIFLISPTLRSGETQLLQDYRDAIETTCTNTAASYIDGSTLLSLENTSDGLHPNDTGHLEYYTNINILL